MPSPTTARGLLGLFPYGVDPPAINQRATTPPVRLPTSSSLRVISAARARGRGVWAVASGRKSRRSAGEWREEWGWNRAAAQRGGDRD